MRKRFDRSELRDIYDRTRGKCHICCKKLAFRNYGISGAIGAWHVEHSIPVAKGGTNHRNNLYAAHIRCNIEKATVTARTARRWNGRNKVPLNRATYEKEKTDNTILGGALGIGIGVLLGGPPGALLVGLLGATLGSEVDPDAP